MFFVEVPFYATLTRNTFLRAHAQFYHIYHLTHRHWYINRAEKNFLTTLASPPPNFVPPEIEFFKKGN